MWILAGLITVTLGLWRRRKGQSMTAYRPLVAPVLVTAALAVAIAQTIVVAALPVFQDELRVSGAAVTWLLTGFMVVSAVATPLAGRLGDRIGYRPVLIACLLAFLVGAVLAAVANSNSWYAGVLAGRSLQGVAGGVFPLLFGLARAIAGPEQRRHLVALLSSMFGVGGALGMVLAGPITDWLGTSALFWCTALLGVAALLGATALPRTAPVPTTGPGLLTVLRGRALATTNLTTVIVSVAMFAAVTLLPQFMQTRLGASPTTTGTAMIPMAALMLIGGPLASRFAARRALQTGAVLAAAAFTFLAAAHQHLWQTYVFAAILGAAYGLAFASLGNLAVDAVPPDQTGAATGINTILRTLGGALGTQLSALALTGGYVVAFLTFAVVALAAAAAAGGIVVGRTSDTHQMAPPA
ncbi:MFS transporter [Kribbella sindirgiensis]|uniref:MFS transporter n=1 Tax=Kribbella sindirgiensis TaxID=1124744 RepID=A0A4V2M498_9ACTN|nr:MFS transporter [Kribbella sindirgiensis]TCC35142.1 MFS transporter [Kribbella sindirgiensis]